MGARLVRPDANVRLRKAMMAAGLTFKDIACEVKVSQKTAERWVYEGRTPRQEKAERLAAYLGVEPRWLWPEDMDGCHMYPKASAMPPAFLHHLTTTADREVWALTDSEWLLCRLRLKPGARLLTTSRLATLHAPVGVEVRAHKASTSVVRADEAIIVIPSGFGLDVPSCPALFLMRTTDDGLFDRYVEGFERLWRSARS